MRASEAHLDINPTGKVSGEHFAQALAATQRAALFRKLPSQLLKAGNFALETRSLLQTSCPLFSRGPCWRLTLLFPIGFLSGNVQHDCQQPLLYEQRVAVYCLDGGCCSVIYRAVGGREPCCAINRRIA